MEALKTILLGGFLLYVLCGLFMLIESWIFIKLSFKDSFGEGFKLLIVFIFFWPIFRH